MKTTRYKFTVLLLRPDYMWDGAMRDCTYQAFVTVSGTRLADRVEAAILAARKEAQSVDRDSCDCDPDELDEYDVLAVYRGHNPDLFRK